MLLKPAGFMRTSAPSAYTEQLVTNPGTRYIDLSNGAELPADTRSVLFFWSGVHSSTSRKYIFSWNDAQCYGRIHTGTNVGLAASLRNDESATGSYEDAGLSGSRYHVLLQFWSTTVTTIGTGTANLEAYVWDSGSGWVQRISVGPNSGDDAEILQDITSAAGRLFARLTGAEIPTCDTARFACWVDSTVGRVADLSSSAVRDEFTSGASTVDPATTQATYGTAASPVGTLTQLFDLYGDASKWNASPCTHTGALTLTPAGTGSFSNA